MEEVVILKAGKKIIINGFAYTINHNLSTSIRWKCSQRLSKKCPGILITSKGFTNPQLINYHSHAGDHNLAVVEKAKEDMNNRMKITTNKPSQVFS
ncbi:FLYWCH-type domain-containing protein, partial [Aphis craccivora]